MIGNAKEYLRQALDLNGLIESDRLELERLEELANSVPSTMPTVENTRTNIPSDKTGEIAAKIVDLRDKINADMAELLDLKSEIFTDINAVEVKLYRTVLQKRYINFLKWEQIALDMNYNYRYTTRLHERALRYFGEKFNI